ncbi:hypothetical protein HDU82_004823 [Entophlyctis luteolus]|nr:hypothetical protein HDU82_004823 [Entophlyctis luteolus]
MSLSSEPAQQLLCEWGGCGLAFADAEGLYKHVAEGHIGKKIPGVEMSLVCRWAACANSYTKRDHLISHLRIHIPFKPHLCPICHRAFKRPQDLKKHDKLHENGASSSSSVGMSSRSASIQLSRTPISSEHFERSPLPQSSVTGGFVNNGFGSPSGSLPYSPPHSENEVVYLTDANAPKRAWYPDNSDLVSEFFNDVKRNKFSSSYDPVELQVQFDAMSQIIAASPNAHHSPSLSSSLGSPHNAVNVAHTSPHIVGRSLETFSNQDLVSVDEFINSLSATIFTLPTGPNAFGSNNYMQSSTPVPMPTSVFSQDLINGQFSFTTPLPDVPMPTNYPQMHPQYHGDRRFSEPAQPVHFLLQPQQSVPVATSYLAEPPFVVPGSQDQQQSFKLPRMVRVTNHQQRAPSASFIANVPAMSGNDVVQTANVNEKANSDSCSHRRERNASSGSGHMHGPVTLPPIHSVVDMALSDDPDNCDGCREAQMERNMQVLLWLKHLVRREMDLRIQRPAGPVI